MADRYIEGFLSGQAVAYCERVLTGMSLAAQLDCPEAYREKLCELIVSEGCNVLVESHEHERVSLWIYREQIAARLIRDLQAAHAPTELGMWGMGRLLGYATNEVTAFVEQSRSASPGESSPRLSSDS